MTVKNLIKVLEALDQDKEITTVESDGEIALWITEGKRAYTLHTCPYNSLPDWLAVEINEKNHIL